MLVVQPKDMGLPTTAYYTKEEVREVRLCEHSHNLLQWFLHKDRSLDSAIAKTLRAPALMRCTLLLLQDGTQKSQKVFVNVSTEVGATEAEEIGNDALEGLFFRNF